jgi:hypothetical protein
MKPVVLKWMKIIAGLLITAFALWLSFRKLNWRLLAASFSQINIFWVILAVATVIFVVYALGWRWRILLSPKEQLSMATLFRLNILSQYVNIIAPGRVGEILRAYLGSRESSISTAYFMGTVAVEKIFDVLVFAGLWVSVPALFAFKEGVRGSFYALFLCFLTLLLLILFIWHPGIFLKCVRFFAGILPKKMRPSVISFFKRSIEAFDLLKKPKVFISVIGLTLGFIILQILTNYFLFKAFHLSLSFWAAIFLLLATQVGNIPPSAPGKVGIFEYAVIVALSIFHIPKSQALSYGLMLHVVAFLPKIFLGMVYISGVDLGKLRRAKAGSQV